jgi:membrane protein implicated in regulation of membrane protease activity
MRNYLKIMTSFSALALAITLFSTSAPAFPGAQAQPAAPASAPAMTATKGTVVETMNSGGYTYLNIDNGGQKTWAAVPNTEIKVGQEVEVAPGMTMNNFTSKTLGRTFEAIVFSQGLVSVK